MLKITAFHDLHGWRPIEIEPSSSLRISCRCCPGVIKVVCGIFASPPSEFSTTSLFVTACHTCGYMGYANPPSESWFDAFYKSEWDAAGKQGINHEFSAAIDAGTTAHPLVPLVESLGLDRDDPILEIGCGFGYDLHKLSALGYRNLTGNEPCEHRREAGREKFGLNIRQDVPTESKYRCIYSDQVLEHSYDPSRFIADCAAMQGDGDYLVLGVPSNAGEPTMGVLMFLPHLHSFTSRAMDRLLVRHGYVPGYATMDHENLMVIAKKISNSDEIKFAPQKFSRIDWRKLDRQLGDGAPKPCRLWWQMHYDKGGYCDESDWPTVAETYPGHRSVSVEPCKRTTEVPFEIHMDGALRMFVK